MIPVGIDIYGYPAARRRSDGMMIEVLPLTFGRARIVVTDFSGILDGW